MEEADTKARVKIYPLVERVGTKSAEHAKFSGSYKKRAWVILKLFPLVR